MGNKAVRYCRLFIFGQGFAPFRLAEAQRRNYRVHIGVKAVENPRRHLGLCNPAVGCGIDFEFNGNRTVGVYRHVIGFVLRRPARKYGVVERKQNGMPAAAFVSVYVIRVGERMRVIAVIGHFGILRRPVVRKVLDCIVSAHGELRSGYFSVNQRVELVVAPVGGSAHRLIVGRGNAVINYVLAHVAGHVVFIEPVEFVCGIVLRVPHSVEVIRNLRTPVVLVVSRVLPDTG